MFSPVRGQFSKFAKEIKPLNRNQNNTKLPSINNHPTKRNTKNDRQLRLNPNAAVMNDDIPMADLNSTHQSSESFKVGHSPITKY